MESELKELLLEGAAGFGVKLDDTAVSLFDQYTSEMLEYNKKVNLTAITDKTDIIIKHYIDSISLLGVIDLPQNGSMIDVGSGAGFPGVPLKIVRPDIQLTCIDSLNKRVLFLEKLVAALQLRNCSCLHLRAEEACRKEELREQFDLTTARAVAKLSTLAEICLPLVKIGGVFCAMKGPDAREEAEQAKNAIALLGGELERIEEFRLPKLEISRTVIIIRKRSKTPDHYPRQTAQINKNPL